MTLHVSRDDLHPGDQFDRPMPQLRGKPRMVTYAVIGYMTYRGREYVLVQSAAQGDGSIAVADLPETVEVTR